MVKSKKRTIIGVIFLVCLFLLCIFAGITIFYRLQPKLVTGEIDSLQKIVIIEHYPGEGGGREGEPKSITTINDKETMYVIYKVLSDTVSIKRRHEETYYTMVTPRYVIELYYDDETEEISVFNAGAVRWLGQPGHFTVTGQRSAESISQFIASIIDI